MTEGVTRRKKRGGSDPQEPNEPTTAEQSEVVDPDQALEGAQPEATGDGDTSDEREAAADADVERVEGAVTEREPPERAEPVEPVDAVAEARRRAVEEPNSVEPRLELARLYRERGDLALALEQLESARSEAPDDVEVLVESGPVLAALGRSADAEKDLRRAQRLDPQRPEVYSHLGIILFKRGLYRQAEAELKRAIELDDRNAEAYFYRGEALNQLGRIDDALEMLERAVQYDPGNAKAYYTMGILYDRKHLRQEATTMYRKAREVGAA